jgi:hypothetical protein
MDGTAILQAFAACPGPDCLNSVITHAFGARVKVYTAIKTFLEKEVQEGVRIYFLCIIAIMDWFIFRTRQSIYPMESIINLADSAMWCYQKSLDHQYG